MILLVLRRRREERLSGQRSRIAFHCYARLRPMDSLDVVEVDKGACPVCRDQFNQVVAHRLEQTDLLGMFAQIENDEFVLEFFQLLIERAGQRSGSGMNREFLLIQSIWRRMRIVRDEYFQMTHRNIQRSVHGGVEDEEVVHNAGDIPMNRLTPGDVQLGEHAFGIQQHFAVRQLDRGIERRL